jgi:hypothetical protein
MAEGSNGTGNGVLTDRTEPLRLRRPQRVHTRFITGRGITTSGKPFQMTPGTILPPLDFDLNWRHEQLDTTTLNSMQPTRLLEMLANLSPEMSKGLWDYMRLLNPGWSVEVYNPGSETPNARGRKIVDDVLDRIKAAHGSVDVVLGRMHMGAYMRGGYFAEAVFDDAGREMQDIATPDPASVRFKVVEDPETKRMRPQLGQWQDTKFVPLDDQDGVAYIPVDPFPGNPYGRPLVAPAMFSALFLLGLLHDLRRVISQQGWPRIHIKVLTEKLLEGLQQDENVTTAADVDKKLQAAIEEVRDTYARLEPDDAYITGDDVDIGGPIGLSGGTNLTGIEAVITVVERMLVRSLKTMPLVLGITDGVSEANANRQWEILVSGVKAMQHLAESMLEGFFELACRMQGVQANVVWEFAEIRSSEAQRDALTRSQEIDNEFKLRDGGIIDQEEAATNLVGHPPALEEAPTPAPATPPADVQPPDANPEPGTANGAMTWRAVQSPIIGHDGDSQLRYRARKARDGVGYQIRVMALLRGTEGAPLLSGKLSDGSEYRLWAIGQDRATGEDIVGRYDVYARAGARTVPTATDRSAVVGGAESRRSDDSGRRTSTGTVRPRHGTRLRRLTQRGAGLR